MKTILLRIKRHRLYRHGQRLMADYMRVVDALNFPIREAEQLCPSLVRRRRRAKACVRLLRSIQ